MPQASSRGPLCSSVSQWAHSRGGQENRCCGGCQTQHLAVNILNPAGGSGIQESRPAYCAPTECEHGVPDPNTPSLDASFRSILFTFRLICQDCTFQILLITGLKCSSATFLSLKLAFIFLHPTMSCGGLRVPG